MGGGVCKAVCNGYIRTGTPYAVLELNTVVFVGEDGAPSHLQWLNDIQMSLLKTTLYGLLFMEETTYLMYISYLD